MLNGMVRGVLRAGKEHYSFTFASNRVDVRQVSHYPFWAFFLFGKRR
jgi:hypothetical protein